MNYLFDNQYLTIKEEQKIPQIIHCVWKGAWYELNQELLAALNIVLKYAKIHRTKVILSDCIQLQTVSLEIQEYIQHQWYTAFADCGLLAEIVISPKDLLGELSIELLFEETQKTSNIILITVNTHEEAEKIAQNIIQKHNTFPKP